MSPWEAYPVSKPEVAAWRNPRIRMGFVAEEKRWDNRSGWEYRPGKLHVPSARQPGLAMGLQLVGDIPAHLLVEQVGKMVPFVVPGSGPEGHTARRQGSLAAEECMCPVR